MASTSPSSSGSSPAACGRSWSHVIPNFHNPAGCTLSLEKRERLVALAAEHDFLIFEDDPYGELSFEGERLPTMLSLDSRRPRGVRLVLLEDDRARRAHRLPDRPAPLIAQITTLAVNTYISPNMLAESIVYEFCRSGAINDSIEHVKRALRERRDALIEALDRYIGEDASFVAPEGGYFLWVELPEEVDTEQLLAAASERGVVFVKGPDFMLEGGRNALRLAYSGVTPDQIDEGVRRLGEALSAIKAPA